MEHIKGFEHYYIYEDGRIYATHINKFISPYDNGLGYQAVKLKDLNTKRRYQKYLHRLVAEHYLGECTNSDVNHIDGNKLNNHVSNLEIVTHKQNMQHAFDNKLLKGFIERRYK